jgi:hypothetical protein
MNPHYPRKQPHWNGTAKLLLTVFIIIDLIIIMYWIYKGAIE